jgi:ArsR family metal-binding transcriptional regulator
MNYLDSITLTKTLPCLAEPGKIIAVGTPSCSLEQVIPYLATLPGVIAYNPFACTLTFRRPHGFMTLFAGEITITQIDNVEEGLRLLKALKEAINAAWEHRQDLKPVTSIQKAPRLLDIWELLPRTNCRGCGEATCMAFASNLLLGNCLPDACPILQSDPAFADRRSALMTITGG